MSKILLGVDDSQMNRFIFLEVKKYFDVDVHVAEDGEKGFELAQRLVKSGQTPNIIITDIHMPVCNGIEFIKLLKGHESLSKIPIFVLSTEQDMEVKMKTKGLGVRGWIPKPLSPEEIAEIVKRYSL